MHTYTIVSRTLNIHFGSLTSLQSLATSVLVLKLIIYITSFLITPPSLLFYNGLADATDRFLFCYLVSIIYGNIWHYLIFQLYLLSSRSSNPFSTVSWFWFLCIRYMILPNQNDMKWTRIGMAVHQRNQKHIFGRVGIMLHGKHSFCTKFACIIKVRSFFPSFFFLYLSLNFPLICHVFVL